MVIGLAASLGLLLFRLKEAKHATNLVTNLPSKLKLHSMKRNPEHVEDSRRRLPLSLQSHSKSSQANPIISNSSFLSNSEDHELQQSPRATKSAVLPAASSTQTTESPSPFSSSTPLNKANITITSTSAKVGEQAKQKEGEGGEGEGERQRYSLKKKIMRFISESQSLRPEEKQLLEFLANKQGVAFESELRNKLLLPETSVWMLIRRPEREEILEVIRLGRQNLIKIKLKSTDSYNRNLYCLANWSVTKSLYLNDLANSFLSFAVLIW